MRAVMFVSAAHPGFMVGLSLALWLLIVDRVLLKLVLRFLFDSHFEHEYYLEAR